jgi:hypothetical protein
MAAPGIYDLLPALRQQIREKQRPRDSGMLARFSFVI